MRRAVTSRRLVFLAAVFVPSFSFAALIRFVCRNGGDRKPVPCKVLLAPSAVEKPVLEFASDTEATLGPGSYEIRAGGRSLAFAGETDFEAGAANSPASGTTLDLAPGGRTKLASEFAAAHAMVRLFSFSTGRIDTVAVDREKELPFPAGDLSAVGMSSSGNVTGISDLLSLRAGSSLEIGRTRPPRRGTSNLLLCARYGAPAPHAGVEISDLWLSAEGSGSAPARPRAMTAKNGKLLFAVFYDLASGRYTAHVASRKWCIVGGPIEVQRDATAVEDRLVLQPTPRLTVKFDADPMLAGQRRKAIAFRCPGDDFSLTAWPLLEACKSEAEASGTADSYLLEGLEPGWVFVEGEIAGHINGKAIELHPAEDAEATLRLHAIDVSGLVTRAQAPIHARLEFEHLNSETKQGTAETDDDGRYRIRLWTPGGYQVLIRSADSPDEAAFRRLVKVEDKPTQSIDFDLPDTTVDIHVTDSDSGQPVAAAHVFAQSQDLPTDENGIVELKSVAPGHFIFGARAEHYIPQRMTVTVQDIPDPQTFQVAMKREREELSFIVLLPSGAPATSARGWIGLGGDPINATGEPVNCDPAGTCRMGSRPADETPLFLYDYSAAITPTTVGAALGAGQVVLRAAGGPTEIVLDSGADPSIHHVLGIVSIDGMTIPNGILRACGNQDMAWFPNNNRLKYRKLPSGQISVSLYSIVFDGMNNALQRLGSELNFQNTAPATLSVQLP